MNAIEFVTQALSDYAGSLPLSARIPFAETANRALVEIKGVLETAAAEKSTLVPVKESERVPAELNGVNSHG